MRRARLASPASTPSRSRKRSARRNTRSTRSSFQLSARSSQPEHLSGKLLLAGTIAFRGATLIDGTGAPPVPNGLLVVRDGRIVSLGPATPEAVAALPPGSDTRDMAGKWIMPGLIDAHVHAGSDEDLKTMLRWGITTARLMEEDTARAVAVSTSSHTRADVPDVYAAAPIFT